MKKHSTIHGEGSFLSFVISNSKNRRLLWILLGAVTLEFILFKLLYPYPSLFSDSYSYIFAAAIHADVNIWPIGYSKFLQFFPLFTRSTFLLVGFQYFFLELSALCFFYTILYFYDLGKISRRILMGFLFFNPLLIYVSNYITSDTLFIGLSLLWVTQLIWIIQRPHPSQILLQGVLLLLAFTVRYNAMYYPLIAAFAFLISAHRPVWKVLGLLAGPLLIIPFIIYSSNAARDLTGTAQFPLLGGWQWGNNALYIREYIDVQDADLPTPETVKLDHLAQDFFRTVPPDQRDLPNYVANYFFRNANAPLRKYMHLNYPARDEYSNLVRWGKSSVVYGDYGKTLIRQHPGAFAQHFILVNTKNYFLPPLEQLKVYNMGLDSIWERGRSWFNLPTVHVSAATPYLQEPLLLIFPPLFAGLNLFFLVAIGSLLTSQPVSLSQGFVRTVLLIGCLLALNFGFSVFANIIVIRYQIFPLLQFLTFGLVIWEKAVAGHRKTVLQTEQSTDTQLYKLS